MPKRSDIRITKLRVDALAAGKTLWDAQTPGFGVTANKHSKSYKLKYYTPEKKQRMLKIGDHGVLTVESARKIAQDFKSQLNNGCDPAEKKIGKGATVEMLCERYMREHASVAKKTSSANGDQANIRNHILPLLGNISISSVDSNQVEKFKLDVQAGKTAPKDRKIAQKKQKGGLPVKGGASAANRCLSLLSKMFNLAETWGYIAKGSNPVRGVTRFKENPKQRYLSGEEIKRLMEHLEDLNQKDTPGMRYVVALIELLLWTGARCSEIRTMKWSMIDLEGGKLSLSESKTGPKPLQLNSQALQVLRGLKEGGSNPYVIVGDIDGKPLVNVQKRWKKIREAVGLHDVRIHDLRHTFASEALKARLSLSELGKLMGHKSVITTQRYAHLSDEQLSAANTAYGNHLATIIASDRGDKKINFTK